MNLFDFNEDGHTDCGEQFTGYQIYKDVTDSSSGKYGNGCRRGRLDGFNIFLMILLAYAVLSALCRQ